MFVMLFWSALRMFDVRTVCRCEVLWGVSAALPVYLDSSEHASGGDAEVQVGQGVGVGRFIQQRWFLLWQIIWKPKAQLRSQLFTVVHTAAEAFCSSVVPVSRTGGQVRTSTVAEASLDLSSLEMSCVVITHTDRLTWTIHTTVVQTERTSRLKHHSSLYICFTQLGVRLTEALTSNTPSVLL